MPNIKKKKISDVWKHRHCWNENNYEAVVKNIIT